MSRIEWDVRWVAETGSTNVDLRSLAETGVPEGTVVVADHQTAGRGRLDRTWTAPPGSALAVSVLLRPGQQPGRSVSARRWPWLPLLVGCAVVDGITATAPAVRPALKWPNDVLIGERKLAGILTERVGEAVVAGIGLNLSIPADQLPVPTATSLVAAGTPDVDRAVLLGNLLRALDHWYGAWRTAGGDPDSSTLRPAYRQRSATLGRPVRIEVLEGTFVEGTARDVDVDGRLVLHTPEGEQAFGAGDVMHARLA